MSNLPPDYIDEWIQGDDRMLLKIFRILRAIKSALAATANDRLISAKLAVQQNFNA